MDSLYVVLPVAILIGLGWVASGGGGFNNPRGRLRTLGLIEYTGSGLRAKDLLFPEGAK